MFQWQICVLLSTQENNFDLDWVGVIPCLQANHVEKINALSNRFSITTYTTLGWTPCKCKCMFRYSDYKVPKAIFMHSYNEIEQKITALNCTHEM
jgi:hypothetical protein